MHYAATTSVGCTLEWLGGEWKQSHGTFRYQDSIINFVVMKCTLLTSVVTPKLRLSREIIGKWFNKAHGTEKG